jgi:exonuclease VII large subunit
VLRKQKKLEECHAIPRKKSLKQRIEEAKATLRELNEQLQNASHEVIHLDEPISTTKASQEKNSQKSFISIDTSSPLSINLKLA